MHCFSFSMKAWKFEFSEMKAARYFSKHLKSNRLYFRISLQKKFFEFPSVLLTATNTTNTTIAETEATGSGAEQWKSSASLG